MHAGMGYTLHCRSCEWEVDEPLELKGEANWLAGRHIAETGHSVALERVECEEGDFYRGGASTEVITDPPPGHS
jgi:hypothetical protein